MDKSDETNGDFGYVNDQPHLTVINFGTANPSLHGYFSNKNNEQHLMDKISKLGQIQCHTWLDHNTVLVSYFNSRQQAFDTAKPLEKTTYHTMGLL